MEKKKAFWIPNNGQRQKAFPVCPEQRRFSGFGRFQASFQGGFPRSFLKLDHFFPPDKLGGSAQCMFFFSMQDGCSSVDTNTEKSYCTSRGCPHVAVLQLSSASMVNRPPLNTFPRKGTGLLTSIKSTTRVLDETILRGMEDGPDAGGWWFVASFKWP